MTFMKPLLIICLACCAAASAGTIVISGTITQSVSDGTGPAANNTALNGIADGDPFTLMLAVPGTLGTGTFAPSSLLFSVPAAPASESGFSSLSLTITASGANDIFSLLGCLNTGSGCAAGNELTANFRIPAALLNAANVAATGLDQPHPMDLLEDDGTTDIQGSIMGYSSVPEPSAVLLCCGGLLGLLLRKRQGGIL